MSIVPLVKMTLFGYAKDKERILAGLQEMGCVHVEPLSGAGGARGGPAREKTAYDALKFLLSCPVRRVQVHAEVGFDPRHVEEQAIALKTKLQDLETQLDRIRARIAELRPWGEFKVPTLDALAGMRLWFYVVPHPLMDAVQALPLVWRAVHRDQSNCYVVVVSKDEPEGMPVLRTHAGTQSLAELERKQAQLENDAADLQGQRESLTRWCDLYMREMWKLEDKAAVDDVSGLTFDREGLFALRGWAPRVALEKLQEFARVNSAALFAEDPLPEEVPPTLLKNRPLFAGGEDLVLFYLTPSYKLWDPSAIVFVSFTVFFAMIFSDAGYGLVIAAIVLWKWKALSASAAGKRFRTLCIALAAATCAWGVLSGGYFGLHIPEHSFLGRLKIVEIENDRVMMPLVIFIGIFHIILANACDAWRRRKTPQVLFPVGWIGVIAGGAALYAGTLVPSIAKLLQILGFVLAGSGALLVVLFAEAEGSLLKRVLGGLHGLTRATNVFGDVLSYMRIFALALAGVSLAVTFNELGSQVARALPGIGVLFAIMIVLFGHALNFALCVVSGFVHGLRLNFIEFFNWSMYEEGRPFKPFAKRGGVVWNKS